MKQWIQQHRRAAILVAVTLALPVYIFLSLLGSALSANAAYRDDIASVEPRIARLDGLIASEAQLRESLSGVTNLLNDHVYPSSSDAAAVAASLQAEVRRTLGDVGLEVTNSQVLAPRKRERFDWVAVKVVARGSLEQLDQGLADLNRYRPVIFVESVDAFPNRRNRRAEGEEQVLTVSLQLMSLRVVQ